MFLQTKLGLSEIGKFTDGKLINSEIAYSFDLSLNGLVSEVLKNSVVETNSFFASLLQDLKFSKEEEINTVEQGSLEFSLPKYLALLKISLETEVETEYDKPYLTVGNYYKPVTTSQINNKWVSVTTRAVESSYYGKVKEIKTNTIPVRLVPTEKVDIFRRSRFSKSTNKSIIGEIIDNKIVIYTNCTKGKLKLTGYKIPSEFKNLKEQDESPYNDLVNTFLIKEVINLNSKIK